MSPARPLPVAPELHVLAVRSPTLPPATHTNAWILGRQAPVVVDPASPWQEERDRLAGALAPAAPQAILLTHHHHDHVSGAADLAARTGAPIWAHAETAARLSLPVDRLLVDEERLDLEGGVWTVLHTPGHAPGHLCLLREADGELIAGDMVAGEGTIVLDPPEGDLALYLASLARLQARGARRLHPAHGPSLEDGPATLQTYVAHRHARTAQIREALARRPGSRPRDLVPLVYGELPELVQLLAARQVLCHLLWLADRQQARRLDDDDAGAQDRWTS